jgi:hypothetical protein
MVFIEMCTGYTSADIVESLAVAGLVSKYQDWHSFTPLFDSPGLECALFF